ncbi:bifunctional hydroxymethylpyrimidine kinase/phosphomethylpyrimidine kinase [Companilactobacillus halodurans]|uniref:pyridoxal kinase n=1 Tax=Companilactobacillus halodurans TaxID=2584183 RepID=A0A5P0ZMX3_9LACO|nr:bifunctional hydroxymethylpyrimidine kinase/phosphomethylpyrimidine kinase [Companilactobacillus halodurans]MQS75532.1 bifunctional hydroxymethylpyrimidine kinase/phosphomethylpyrimidine kinase [Companilactobacillus halodurans]MQS97776.1 bifunctional hydroxymethylpyrimidine kinase/phosphomethylpyrimidine kinase [Companilactobacillus halodurans]
MENVLTIAGSDSLAGGGLEADLKTFEELDTFGLSVVTSIVSIQKNGIAIYQEPISVIEQQLDSVLNNLPIHYLKTGLLGDLATLKLLTSKLRQRNQKMVVDPVLVFKEGDAAIEKDYLDYYRQNFLPMAYLSTPNLDEAAKLSGMHKLKSRSDIQLAAEKIQAFGCKNVVIKGGSRLPGEIALDYAKLGQDEYWLEDTKILTGAIDGAGCTFSAAITAQLAQGESLISSIKFAKEFVHLGIENGIIVNKKLGNVWQGAYRQKRINHGA